MAAFLDQVLGIIAQEVNEPAEELTPEVEFVALGVDKLLAKSIITRSMKATGLDLPSNLFQSCPTVGSLADFLTKLNSLQSSEDRSLSRATTSNAPSGLGLNIPLSIHLQGSPKTATKTIFFLPDGSGSALSYARLPPLGSGICLYGLNSPFLSRPQEFLPIPEIAPIWAAEILRLQPTGPYILGGWSAGGYYGFEVAKYLMHNVTENDGQPAQVEKLIMIDSPCRVVFEALPMKVVNILSSNGLMGNWGAKQPPQWLLDHFQATIARVEEYSPEPLMTISSQQNSPEVFVIWATNGACPPGVATTLGLDLSTKVSRFMLNERANFGPNGWDKLFPKGTKMGISRTPGTHFTLVSPPHSSNLGWLLQDILDSAREPKGVWEYSFC